MTNEEALEIIKGGKNFDKVTEALKVAVKALEEQVNIRNAAIDEAIEKQSESSMLKK